MLGRVKDARLLRSDNKECWSRMMLTNSVLEPIENYHGETQKSLRMTHSRIREKRTVIFFQTGRTSLTRRRQLYTNGKKNARLKTVFSKLEERWTPSRSLDAVMSRLAQERGCAIRRVHTFLQGRSDGVLTYGKCMVLFSYIRYMCCITLISLLNVDSMLHDLSFSSYYNALTRFRSRLYVSGRWMELTQ